MGTFFLWHSLYFLRMDSTLRPGYFFECISITLSHSSGPIGTTSCIIAKRLINSSFEYPVPRFEYPALLPFFAFVGVVVVVVVTTVVALDVVSVGNYVSVGNVVCDGDNDDIVDVSVMMMMMIFMMLAMMKNIV